MHKQLKVIGIIAIIFGILATLLCLMPYGPFLGVLFGLVGLILSTIYIFIDTKNQINTSKYTIGFWAMILSSVPIVYVLSIIIMVNMK